MKFTPITATRRLKTSSADHNTAQRDIHEDLVTLRKKGLENNALLEKTQIIYQAEAEALLEQINGLESALGQARNTYTGTSGEHVHTETFWTMDNVWVSASSAVVNTEVGHVTLAKKNDFSKLYSPDTNGILRPYPDLTLTIGVPDPSYNSPSYIDEDIDNSTITAGNPFLAFNGDCKDYWVRRVQNDPQSSVRVQITADLPVGTSSWISRLTVFPFPEGKGQLIDLAYSATGTSYTSIGDIVDPNGSSYYSFPVNLDRKREYIFPRVQAHSLRYVIETDYSTAIDGSKAFVYGARELGSFLTEYESTGDVIFRIPTRTPSSLFFNRLTHISCQLNERSGEEFVKPSPTCSTDAGKYVRIRLYATQDMSEAVKVFDSNEDSYPQDSSPINVAAYGTPYLWAKVTLTRMSDNITPTLKSFTAVYET